MKWADSLAATHDSPAIATPQGISAKNKNCVAKPGAAARVVERVLPNTALWGGFALLVGEKTRIAQFPSDFSESVAP